ncbi:hypothetical protein CCO1270 [Campylobacter coli RM2228]|nr:hypothetical protein CCO1270 [Campylobacter coli RM2228]
MSACGTTEEPTLSSSLAQAKPVKRVAMQKAFANIVIIPSFLCETEFFY